MAGDSSRFDSKSTHELQKLALGYKVKGVVLSHLLSARQEKEASKASSRASRAEKDVKDIESRYTEEGRKFSKEIEGLERKKKESHEALVK
ncbi:hypothetical protein A2U01_0070168, partial [Trifolium medium]|nr:hypothetical protein [Trifolium medium]